MLSLKDAETEMNRRLLRRMPKEGSYTTPLEDVMVHRLDETESPRNRLYRPRFVYVAAGKKEARQEPQNAVCSENVLMIAGIDTPCTSNIVDATPNNPSTAISIKLDMNLIGQLAMTLPLSVSSNAESFDALKIQAIDGDMLNAFLRLESILDRPKELAVLGPMIIKELHFRLLLGPNGGYLRSLYSYGVQTSHVALAVSWLRSHFKQAFHVEDLAEKVHMSVPTFYRHFKEITSLTPIQFQKHLRLREAQWLMISKDVSIAEACDAVGYESATQFTKDYKRLFGEPPRTDVTRWKKMNFVTAPLAIAE